MHDEKDGAPKAPEPAGHKSLPYSKIFFDALTHEGPRAPIPGEKERLRDLAERTLPRLRKFLLRFTGRVENRVPWIDLWDAVEESARAVERARGLCLKRLEQFAEFEARDAAGSHEEAR